MTVEYVEMLKPWKHCECCGGDGYIMKRVHMESGTLEKYQAACMVCNGCGILIREPRLDSQKAGLGYRKMRGLFA